jgi:hypothetical protein
VFVDIASVCTTYGLTTEEMLAELQSGRLVAHMTDNGPMLRTDKLLEWMIKRRGG